MSYTYTTQKQIREAFWEAHPDMDLEARKRGTRSKGQNEQYEETRIAFCDFIEHLHRSGEISDALLQRVTL